MAKKKASTKATAKKTDKSPTSPELKTSDKPARTKKSPKKASSSPSKKSKSAAVKTTATRPLTNAEIGTVAGEVWQTLYRDGEQSLASLKKSVDASPDLVNAAIGWLAREDKLDFRSKGRSTKLALR